MAVLSDFYAKQNDTGEPLVITCQYSNGTGVTRDFTGASVEFHMRDSSGGVLVAAGAGTVVSITLKQVGYQWVTGDLSEASWNPTDLFGRPHQAELQVTYSDGIIETFPNDRNINVHVFPELG